MKRRKFVKCALAGVPLSLAAAVGYARYCERHAVEVVTVPIALGLPKPFSVALLSDIHFDPLFETGYLESVIARTNQLAPDMIVFAGDFVSHSLDRLADLGGILSKATATFGKFAVLGNHDHWVGADQVVLALESAGVTVLRNQSAAIPGCEPWYLTGLESFWCGKPDPSCIERLSDDARHILLAHEPDSFDELTDPRIALQLSGHTHGGQVRLPMLGAIQLPKWGKKYQAGMYERSGQKLYVNRGIGTVMRHYRLNCAPEISLLRLT
jgi:predicted MPP superfamily phosphohydrolase